MSDNQPPSGAWLSGGNDFNVSFEDNGRDNIGWGTIDTASQRLFGSLRFTPYKYSGNDPNHDYYAFNGMMNHGVTNYGDNWVSVGYYATHMKLQIECTTEGRSLNSIYDYGPSTTVGSHTTSFTIGGDLSGGASGDGPEASAGINASWGVSFSSPDVTFAASPRSNVINWNVSLPGVGFVSSGIPANPHEPSKNGYSWRPAFILRVPKNSAAQMLLTTQIVWDYDYTRGITNDTKSWNGNYRWTYNGRSSTIEMRVPKLDMSNGFPRIISSWDRI